MTPFASVPMLMPIRMLIRGALQKLNR